MAKKTFMPGDTFVEPNVDDFLNHVNKSRPAPVTEKSVETVIKELDGRLEQYDNPDKVKHMSSCARIGLPAAYRMSAYLKSGRMDFWKHIDDQDIKKLGLEIPASKFGERKAQLDYVWDFFEKLRKTQYWRDSAPVFKYYINGGVAVIAHLLNKPQDKVPDKSPDIWRYFGVTR